MSRPYVTQSISLSGTATVATPAITFSVADHTYGDIPFTISATSNSTGAFTYTVVSGPATISGSTVTLTGAGTVVLRASQAADYNYTIAAQNASFNVAALTPAISFTVPNHTYGDAAFMVSATSEAKPYSRCMSRCTRRLNFCSVAPISTSDRRATASYAVSSGYSNS